MKLVVVDRDGTLIEHVPYLHTPDRVRLLPTVVDGVRMLREAGCKLFLHTNQSGIGRGYFSHDDAVACNERVIEALGLGDDVFERICLAPEAPDQEIAYRKPSPRFGLELLAQYGVGAGDVYYVGDNATDLLTARNVGCEGVGVNTGVHDLRRAMFSYPDLSNYPVFDCFVEAASYVAGERE